MERIDFEIVPEGQRHKRDRKPQRELTQSEIMMILTNRIEHHKHDTGNQQVIEELRLILHVVGNSGILRNNPAVYCLNIVLEKMMMSYEEVFKRNENGYLSQKKEHTLCRGLIIYFIRRHTPLTVEDIMDGYIGLCKASGDYLLKRLRKRAYEEDFIVPLMMDIDNIIHEHLSRTISRFKRKEPISISDI